MSILSEDLLHEVLSFLPSNDLLRLRCVSKSWRALIDSPYFIQLHLNKSLKDIKSPKVVVTSFYDGDDDGWKHIFYAISFDSEFKFSVPKEIKPCIQNLSWLDYIGCCRSLICLSYFTRDNEYEPKIAVWNPFTRSHRTLPFAPVETEDKDSKNPYPNYCFRYAFGYDEVADDYKVVRLALRWTEFELHDAQVYSLKLDAWKQIVKVPIRFKNICQPIYANGAILWLSGKWGKAPFYLLILPLRTQVLQLVSFPASDSELKYCFFDLFHYASSCGFHYCCDCRARDLLKLINNIKNDTVTNLLLPHSNIINEAMGYIKHSFHGKLSSELRPFFINLHHHFTNIETHSIDSLLRVEQSMQQ